MRKLIITSLLYTGITAVLLGIVYPLAVTGLAQLTMRSKANGQLVQQHGETVGSALIGQPFTGPGYFHSRPSSAGSGYDAANSAGSNLGPTSKALADRIDSGIRAEGTGSPVPVDLVTASGSGLDPDISPASALYQVQGVAQQRQLNALQVTSLVNANIQPRQFGLLGEPRVNVLALNLALNRLDPHAR